MSFILCGAALVVAGGLLTHLFPGRNRLGPWTATLGVISGSCLIIPAAFAGLLARNTVATGRIVGLAWQFNPLAAFFVLIIACIAPLTSIYAQGYLGSYQRNGSDIRINLLLFNVLIAAMLLVPLAGEMFSFLIIWEIMTMASFLLVIYEHRQEESLRAGIKYLVAMHISFILILSGLALASSEAGSTSFQRIAGHYAAHPGGIPAAVVLLFLGFAIKAGFLPFHIWLPEAHPAAPTHVSAVMSGLMIKTGLFGLLFTIDLFSLRSISFALPILVLAALSGLYGVIYALGQRDLKRVLAYSSVENVGLIGIGLGLGLLGQAIDQPAMAFLGYAGALLHLAGHAVFKSLLFFAAGSVYQFAHTRDLELLGGLHRRLPWTAGWFLAGSLAISGLPPFNGFVSEYLLYAAFFTGVGTAAALPSILGLGGILVLSLIGGLALACFARAFGLAFLGEPRSSMPEKKLESPRLVLPMAALAGLALVMGLFPQGLIRLLAAPVESITGQMPVDIDRLAMQAGRISLVCLIYLGIAAGLAILRGMLLRWRNPASVPTWGCGYHGVTSRMQYTGSSFADGIIRLCGRLAGRDARLHKPRGILPAGGGFKAKHHDLLDLHLLKPALGFTRGILERFRWIQHGDIRNYLLYALAFLVLSIAIALGS